MQFSNLFQFTVSMNFIHLHYEGLPKEVCLFITFLMSDIIYFDNRLTSWIIRRWCTHVCWLTRQLLSHRIRAWSSSRIGLRRVAAWSTSNIALLWVSAWRRGRIAWLWWRLLCICCNMTNDTTLCLTGEMSSRLWLIDANLQMHRPTLPPKGSAI